MRWPDIMRHLPITSRLLSKRGIAMMLAVLPAASVSSMGSLRLPFPPQGVPPREIRAESAPSVPDGHPEREIVEVLKDIRGGQLQKAETRLNQLIATHPNYRLAYLVRGDLLQARAHPLRSFGDASQVLPEATPDVVADLRQEAEVRVKRYTDDIPADRVPAAVLQMAPEQRYLLAVDVVRSRLYVYQNDNGTPRRIDDFYITIGKNGFDKYVEGDQRTPLGVYFVVSELPHEKLPDLYGAGAFPINYPNEWDRRQGRTGHGIWLHGSPSDTYSRPPHSSNGCVALTNPDLLALAKYLQIGVTPVIIGQRFDWVAPKAAAGDRQALLGQIEAWRRDRESRDAHRYLTHYADDFRSKSLDRAAWTSSREGIDQTQPGLKLSLRNLSLLRYPTDPHMVVATFEREEQVGDQHNRSLIRQYWRQDGKSWKIVFEDNA